MLRAPGALKVLVRPGRACSYSPSALALRLLPSLSLLLLRHGESSSVAASFSSDTGDAAGEAPPTLPPSSDPGELPAFPLGGFSAASCVSLAAAWFMGLERLERLPMLRDLSTEVGLEWSDTEGLSGSLIRAP